MVYIGIDPGVTGGVAVIAGNAQPIACQLLPMTVLKSKTVLDVEALLNMLNSLKGDSAYAMVEHQHARVMQVKGSNGALRRVDTPTTTFSLGYSYGAIRAVLTATSIGHEVVEPAVWKKYYGLTAAKGEAIALAKQLFPGVSLTKPQGRTDMDGLAEALLIAEYGRRRNPVTASAWSEIDEL